MSSAISALHKLALNKVTQISYIGVLWKHWTFIQKKFSAGPYDAAAPV